MKETILTHEEVMEISNEMAIAVKEKEVMVLCA